MAVPALVEERRPPRQPLGQRRRIEHRLRPGHLLDEVEKGPPVAVRHRHELRPRLGRHRQRMADHLLRPPGEPLQRRLVEPPQRQHLRPRQKRRVELERRVLRRRADEDDGPVLHQRQEGVLLRLVEAVDLVDEEQRPPPVSPPHPRRLEDLAQVRDPGEDRAHLHEGEVRRIGEQPRDRGLADPRRPPENDRAEVSLGQHRPERPLRPEHMLLPDHLPERARPHPVGQRPRPPRRLRLLLRALGGGARQRVGGTGIEEVGHGPHPSTLASGGKARAAARTRVS